MEHILKDRKLLERKFNSTLSPNDIYIWRANVEQDIRDLREQVISMANELNKIDSTKQNNN